LTAMFFQQSSHCKPQESPYLMRYKVQDYGSGTLNVPSYPYLDGSPHDLRGSFPVEHDRNLLQVVEHCGLV